MADLQDHICDMLRDALPNYHEKLQEEYKELLDAVFERKKGPTECLEFISAVEDSLYGSAMTYSPKQVLLVRHLILNLREQFLDDGDAVDFLLGRLEMLEIRKRGIFVDTHHLVDAHCLIAYLFIRKGQIEESEQHYQKAKVLLEHSESTELKSAEAVINAGLAHINYQKGGSEDVTNKYFLAALNIIMEHVVVDEKYLRRENGIMRIQVLVALNSLTHINDLRKLYDRMETLLMIALPIAEAESEVEEIRVLSWLVQATGLQKKNEEMLKFVMKASDTIQEIRNQKSIFRSRAFRRMIRHHERIATTLYVTGSKERSIAYVKNILELAKEVFGERHPLVAQECAKLACYYKNNSQENANIYREMAESILSRISLLPSNERFLSIWVHEMLNAHFDLGHYYQYMRDFKSAERHFGDGLELCRWKQRNSPIHAIKWHRSFSSVNHHQYQKQNAINHAEMAYKLAQTCKVYTAMHEELLEKVRKGYQPPSYHPRHRKRKKVGHQMF